MTALSCKKLYLCDELYYMNKNLRIFHNFKNLSHLTLETFMGSTITRPLSFYTKMNLVYFPKLRHLTIKSSVDDFGRIFLIYPLIGANKLNELSFEVVYANLENTRDQIDDSVNSILEKIMIFKC